MAAEMPAARPGRRAVLLAAAALAAPRLAPAQEAARDWPNRPIRIVVPSPTGGYDIYARLLAPKLAERLGQPVVVDNRVGANGNVGMAEVARAPADGHTILFAATGTLAINVSVYRNMPADPFADLIPVGLAVTVPMVWLASPAATWLRGLPDLIARAREMPGKVDYALPASGSLNHLIVERFKQRHGLDITPIPYRGTAAAQTDLIGGRIPVMVDSLGAASGHIAAGRVVPLAVTTRARAQAAPELPSVIELGLDDREYVGWYAFMAPRGTPAPAVAKFHAAFAAILAEEEVAARIRQLGAVPSPTGPEGLASFMAEEREVWGSIVRAAGVEPQ
jgi:tripartite-type tricarboxylate transporter receptor subunit TctC